MRSQHCATSSVRVRIFGALAAHLRREADDALGRKSVQTMKSAPRKNSQISGAAPVNKLLAPLTAKAPTIAPTSVPRPPTATQTAISIELPGDISLGLMMPTCGT